MHSSRRVFRGGGGGGWCCPETLGLRRMHIDPTVHAMHTQSTMHSLSLACVLRARCCFAAYVARTMPARIALPHGTRYMGVCVWGGGGGCVNLPDLPESRLRQKHKSNSPKIPTRTSQTHLRRPHSAISWTRHGFRDFGSPSVPTTHPCYSPEFV